MMSGKKRGLIGIRHMQIEHGVDTLTTIRVEFVAAKEYDAHHMLSEKWGELFPGNAIVKCQYCGRWAARKTTCTSCGGQVD